MISSRGSGSGQRAKERPRRIIGVCGLAIDYCYAASAFTWRPMTYLGYEEPQGSNPAGPHRSAKRGAQATARDSISMRGFGTSKVIARPLANLVSAMKPSSAAARRGSPIDTLTSPARAGRW